MRHLDNIEEGCDRDGVYFGSILDAVEFQGFQHPVGQRPCVIPSCEIQVPSKLFKDGDSFCLDEFENMHDRHFFFLQFLLVYLFSGLDIDN